MNMVSLFDRISLWRRGILVAALVTACRAGNSPDGVPANRVGEIEQSIGFYQAIELAENPLLANLLPTARCERVPTATGQVRSLQTPREDDRHAQK